MLNFRGVVLLLPMIDDDSCMPFPSFCVKQNLNSYIFTKLQNNHGFTTNSLSPPDHGISSYGVDATFSDLVKVAEFFRDVQWESKGEIYGCFRKLSGWWFQPI